MMEVLLITGFLGAGKTTLIQHLLRSEFNAQEKVAVIVNEVGEIGIDGTLLAGQDVDILELTSGCICCTIKTDFFKAVQEIHQTFNPSYLVVETTGVAQPGDMLDVLFEPPLSDFSRLRKIITVVDADFFEAREVLATFYDNQIKCADALILNKIDQVDDIQIGQIEAVLRELNPGASIISTHHSAVDPATLLGVDSSSRHHASRDHHALAHEQEGFHSFCFEDKRVLDRAKLNKFLETLPPNLFRCKGWVRFPEGSQLLNYSGGSFRLEPDDGLHDTALVFVGRNCDEKEILRSLKECLETVS
jgi:G3E family GTPase